MKMMLLSNGGWLLRILTVSVLLVVVGLSLFPRVVSHISTSAIVNAPILVIRSPVEGLIEGRALEHGTLVSRGQEIAVFREAGTDLRAQTGLEARLSMAEAAITAVEERIVEVQGMQSSLQARHRTYQEWQSAILRSEIDGLQAQLRGATARRAALEVEEKRKRDLNARQIVADSARLEAATQLTETNERVKEIKARLRGRRLQLDAMQDDVTPGTTGTNTPYTLQRQDEVKLELARLRDELTDHKAEYAQRWNGSWRRPR